MASIRQRESSFNVDLVRYSYPIAVTRLVVLVSFGLLGHYNNTKGLSYIWGKTRTRKVVKEL